MEIRKKNEIEHYDKLAREWQIKTDGDKAQESGSDVELIDVMKMASYQFVYNLLKKYVFGKKVLDYGCGHGMHAISIAKMGAEEVIGIDLSKESLKIAEQRTKQESLGEKVNPVRNNMPQASAGVPSAGRISNGVKFIKMDAENLEFPDNYFDIIFDGGTFSSIDINKAFSEIKRVLRPGGYLIGIETLGHNPLTNFKRWLSKKSGRRTEWAAGHIMKMKDFKLAKRYFKTTNVHFFHLTSLAVMPFQKISDKIIPVKILAKAFEGIDKFLLKLPFLKRFAFKAVFVFSK